MSIRNFMMIAAFLPLLGCGRIIGSGPKADLGQAALPPTAFGYVVADEPQAALIGRQILNQGGNAADAAAAMGFALSVTLPSRAGLGGGGACIVKVADGKGAFQPPAALLFPPGAPASRAGSRPAAVPTMARGLLALEARYGSLQFAAVIVPAERLAGGVAVSPALASDLDVVGGALLADPAAATLFAGPAGGVLAANDNLQQPDLAATFELLRTQGVQGLYQGSFPAQFAAAANQTGASLDASDLTAALPQFAQPSLGQAGSWTTASLPDTSAPAGQNLPASTGFAALDKNGGVVACVTTMNNLFGTGRIAPGTGILLAVSPNAAPAPLLRAVIAYGNGSGVFRAAATGTGQQQATAAAAQGLQNALRNTTAEVADPGRSNVISCPGGVPGEQASCTASADPRGQGLAIGGR